VPNAFLPKARTRGIVVERIDGETLVYVEETQRALCLNPPAARILALCNGTRTPETIALEVELETSVVSHALWHLAESGLLKSPPPRLRASDLSRRRVLIGVGLAAIPIVLMVTAPEARASASNCTMPGTTCSPLTPQTCCSGECSLGVCN
jgi:hypothetical protein